MKWAIRRNKYNTKKKDKRTNSYLQNITQKIEARATRIPLNPAVNSGAPER